MTTLTITGLLGTPVTLKKINQDKYTGEFFKRDGNTEYRVLVRHSNEAVKANQLPMSRHNVEVSATKFALDGSPTRVITSYYVLRRPLSEEDEVVSNVASNLVDFLSASNIGAVLGWETDLVSAA